jgi:hypothetical protein
MASSQRIDLAPRGRARLVVEPGRLRVEASMLAAPWVIEVGRLAWLDWISPMGVAFRAELPRAEAVRDDCSVVVDLARGPADLSLRFRESIAVPFRRGRSLRVRSLIMWAPPHSARVLLPGPRNVRLGRATSLSVRAATDGGLIRRALEDSGLSFPQYGSPMS